MTTTTSLRLSLPAETSSIRVIRDAVARAATDLHASGSLVDAVRLAVTEAATNVVRHAYVSSEDGTVRVTVEHEEGWMVVTVSDSGIGIVHGPSGDDPGFGLRIVEALASRFVIDVP